MGNLIYILCGVFGVLGRLFALVLGGRRELTNRRIEFRFHVLVDAWRIIERAAAQGIRDDALERALADVRLLGAATQVELATLAASSNAIAGGGARALGELRDALRFDLRSEMRLPRIAREAVRENARRAAPHHFEVEPKPAQLLPPPPLHLVRRADVH